MSVPKAAVKVAISFHGTFSSSSTPQNAAGNAANAILKMTEQTTVSALHKANNTPPGHKLELSGPGTDILDVPACSYTSIGGLFNKTIGLARTIMGGIAGSQFGDYSVEKNLAKAIDYIKKIKTENPNQPLDIDITGWSRGAFSAYLLKEHLMNTPELLSKEDRIFAQCIDPVPGGPQDRWFLAGEMQKLDRLKAQNHQQRPSCDVVSYYSHTGNINYFDFAMGAASHMNMPFFSGLYNEGDNFLLPANHEGIAGKEATSPTEALIGQVVQADIMLRQIEHGFQFDPKVEAQTLRLGQEAISKLQGETVKVKADRKFLRVDSEAASERSLYSPCSVKAEDFNQLDKLCARVSDKLQQRAIDYQALRLQQASLKDRLSGLRAAENQVDDSQQFNPSSGKPFG